MDATCDRHQRSWRYPKGHRRRIRGVRQGDGGHGHEERPSAGQTASASVILAAIIAPEFANIITDDTLAWTVHLTLNEAAKGLLCLALSLTVPRLRFYGYAGTIWFITQAMDEATNGNLFHEHTYEYPLLVLLGIAAYIASRR